MKRGHTRWWAIECGRLVLIALLYGASLAVAGALNLGSRVGFVDTGGGLSWLGVLLSFGLMAPLWLLAKRPVGLVSRFLGPAPPFKKGLLIVLSHWGAYVPVVLLSLGIFVVSASVRENRYMRSLFSKPPSKTYTSRRLADGRVIKAYFDEARRPKRVEVWHPDGSVEVQQRSKQGKWSREHMTYHFQLGTTPKRRAGWLQLLYTHVFIAPIYEEILFRGVLYLLLLYPFGRIGSGVAVALLFSAAHLGGCTLDAGGAILIQAVFSSYLLTSVLLRSRRLSWCIVLHLMYNGTLLVLRILVESFGRYLPS